MVRNNKEMEYVIMYFHHNDIKSDILYLGREPLINSNIKKTKIHFNKIKNAPKWGSLDSNQQNKNVLVLQTSANPTTLDPPN